MSLSVQNGKIVATVSQSPPNVTVVVDFWCKVAVTAVNAFFGSFFTAKVGAIFGVATPVILSGLEKLAEGMVADKVKPLRPPDPTSPTVPGVTF